MASTQRHKFRRKDLRQPDEFMTVAFTVEQFVEHHLNKAIAALAGVLILAAGGFALYRYEVSVGHQAAEQFYEGFTALGSKDYKSAEQQFKALIAERPSSRPARLARFYLGLTHLATGDKASARQELEAYIGDAPEESLRELALMDLGVVYEQMGEFGKAVQTYQQAGDLNGPNSANARLAAARVLESQGKRDAAIQAYQQFLKANPYAAQRDTVVQALANLGVSVPAAGNATTGSP